MTTYLPPLTDGWTSVSDTKAKRSGKLVCGICGKNVEQAKWIPVFVCPDSKCLNSEERYYD